MSHKLRIPALIVRVLCIALLIVCAVTSVVNLTSVCGRLLDSDAASELVLAHTLASRGQFVLSPDWVYSTELRVLNTQLIYAPLFWLFSDWTTVRLVGALLLELAMLASYAFFARQARMSFNSWCVTASALLLPYSVAYGRIVLYHTYYIPHIALGFLLVGLYLSLAHAEPKTRKTGCIVRTVLMGVLALLAGLGGVRQLMITCAPLVAASVLQAMLEERPDSEPLLKRTKAPLYALLLSACCGIGYLVNAKVLSKLFTFQDYTVQTVMTPDHATLNSIVLAFLRQFGFDESMQLFSLPGIASIGVVLMCLIAVVVGVHVIRRSEDARARFVQLYAMFAVATMFLVLLLVNGDFNFMLYLLPVGVWVPAALGKADLNKAEEAKPSLRDNLLGSASPNLTMTKLVAGVAVIPLLLNGLQYGAFFRDPNGSGYTYDGLNYVETDDLARLSEPVDFLLENGCTMGYATFWNANIVTEMTDGKIAMCGLEADNFSGEYSYYNWLTDLRLRDPAYVSEQKTFLLLSIGEAMSIDDDSPLFAAAEKVYDGASFVIYAFDDPLTMQKFLAGELGSTVYEEDEW